MTMLRTLITLFCLSWVSSALSQEPLWTHALSDEVEWSQITSAGTLLVSTGKQISHIDNETGKLLWEKSTEKKLAPLTSMNCAAAAIC